MFVLHGIVFLGLYSGVLLTPAAVCGAPGDLDPSFGSGGVVTTAIGMGPLASTATAVALQPDGKIVAAGFSTNNEIALARYTTAGALDKSFGSGGIVTTAIGGLGSAAYAVALQPDGNIVVVGTSGNLQPCGPNGVTLEFSNFALARYTASGSLDASFGSGGTVTTVIPCTTTVAYAGALQADGKILAAGTLNNGSTPSLFALARYSPDGNLDASFGSGGMVTTPIGDLTNEAHGIALQPDGQIVLAGFSSTEFTDPHFALARYTADGGLDATFGSGGTVTTAIGPFFSEALGIALQPDGKIVAAGFADNVSFVREFALARYAAAGSLDATFGSGGTLTTAIGPSAEGDAAALQPDGKIILAGNANNGFALARYTPTGSLDTSFGGGGTVTTAIGAGAAADAVALQPNGRIVAAGSEFEGGIARFALARYLGDACLSAPRPCRTAEKSLLLVRNKSDSTKDKLLWKWTRGAPTSQAEFADPTTTTNYSLCTYAGTTSALIAQSVVPASATTWSVLGTKGYRYSDPTAAADGIAKVLLKGGQNKSRVLVRGKGAALPVLPLPLTAPVTVQLVNGDSGLCWGASFSDMQLLKNDAGQLKARAP
jgi:uncharacterized delta-60 repeat protein